MKWVFVLALAAACSKNEPPAPEAKPQPMSAAEIARSKDACADYVRKVCACADQVPAMKHQCDLARALPDAVRLSLEVAASPDSKPDDVQGAQASVRKTAKECIEETAKLPAAGCR